MRRNVAVLGSTGSIGRQTLDVARQFPEQIKIYGLAGHRNTDLLRAQAAEFQPQVVVSGGNPGQIVAPEILTGEAGMVDLATRDDVDLIIVATVGSAGLAPTLAALDAGKLVALANKETLVMAGQIIRERLDQGSGQLVPIDSEHSAIWQTIQGEAHRSIESLTLTASGGPLRDRTAHELHDVTPDEALRHPTWHMGSKVTVDSATLMNKGLEVIEAAWLFDVPMDRISVVLHPQSVIHSLVTFDDGSTKAQLGPPDMRLPIQYALSYPSRWRSNLPRLDLTRTRELTFAPVDMGRYPALELALEAGRAGGVHPAVLCAADEIAVDAFLSGRIRFTEISTIVKRTLDEFAPWCPASLADILGADRRARDVASRLVTR